MISEGAQYEGESGKTYLAVSHLGQPNVWTAVQTDDHSHIVVIKEPGAEDTQPGWPSFQNEMIMHELLKNCPSIRRQVDRIPPASSNESPKLLLEMCGTTLWTARTKRPFTTQELKWVTKSALVGLRDVHDQGLVYADLKMQNIMLDGFDVNKPGRAADITAKLGDLGIVMPPANGKVQPVAYRAPEVYFLGEITSKADIWGWGLIYCHLLEARTRFNKTGLYDDLETEHGTIREREGAIKYAISNDYEIKDEPYYKDVAYLPPNNVEKEHGDQWEVLRRRGLEEGEVDFLRWVMRADPQKRPSAEQILRCGWLDKTDEGVSAGFQVPYNAGGRASMEFDPRRTDEAKRAIRHEQATGRHNEQEAVSNVPSEKPISPIPSHQPFASHPPHHQSFGTLAPQRSAATAYTPQQPSTTTYTSPQPSSTTYNSHQSSYNYPAPQPASAFSTPQSSSSHVQQQSFNTLAPPQPSSKLSNTTSAPNLSAVPNEGARQSMLDSVLDEVYATRNTYKRRHS